MNARIAHPAAYLSSALCLTLALVACAVPPSSEPDSVEISKPADVERAGIEQSVAPNINQNFVSAGLDVKQWVARFEGESREVYRARLAVLAALDLQPGARVADIGAGTGLFVQLFSRSVGQTGVVHAVDISPKFLEFIATNAKRDGYSNVRTQLGADRSAGLSPASVDVIFHCDTYHHFEFPQAMNADLLRTLKPGGELFVLDFERIPGVTPPGLLQHVRAPKQTVIEEVTAIGFVLVEEIPVDGLKENYLLRFRKP